MIINIFFSLHPILPLIIIIFIISESLARFHQRGPNSPNWRGGRQRTSAGYITIYAPDHQRATKKYGQVLEHIVVMESKLGRSLFSGENVHHINGVRNDNRPENLELWVTSQPSGQRPEDLVTWAKEILARYEAAGVTIS